MTLEKFGFAGFGSSKVYKTYKCGLAVFLAIMFIGSCISQLDPLEGQENYLYTGWFHYETSHIS